MHANHMSQKVFKLNWDFTLILFRNFHLINKFLPIIETLIWLEVITLTKISQDFTLIN